MNGKNSEGYQDPTATQAIKKAEKKMPKHVWEAYKALNAAASIMGFELIGLRDRNTGKEWRR